ncbi:MAG: hypothetical protein CM15mP77_3630 [Synechococcus sp.]|nr:MAG: hypothetical protein CM15mP77_3630 [Synechococcus sp.]
MLHLTCLHTSCSLTINENADPRVLKDLADWMADIVPESRPTATPTREPTTCRPTSARRSPPQTLSISVDAGQLVLGTWQAVYLWEHRRRPHQRRVLCHLLGEPTPLEAKTKS